MRLQRQPPRIHDADGRKDHDLAGSGDVGAKPAQKTGAELFHTACGICHFAAPRASVVPDLLTAREPRDAAFWRKWISEGKEGTLMPAFAQAQGGPLTDQQIESLIEFALASLPTQPRKE